MKYLLLIALALLALWWWRSLPRRGTGGSQTPKQPPAPPPPPQDMIACRHCGVHLPGLDAIAGGQGSYCSAAHRQAAEGQ